MLFRNLRYFIASVFRLAARFCLTNIIFKFSMNTSKCSNRSGSANTLSFNKFYEGEKCVDVNFLLPPLQTFEGVETAVKAIRHFQKHIDLPFIFETGTNYLKPKKFEIDDGDFVAQIAESADSGILLDLTSVFANQRNGRQKVCDFISQIPLERVFEIHIVHSIVHNKYYLDAHSGVSDAELFEILQSVVVKAPNLKAINFEMLPQYVEYVSNDDLRKQFENMNRIWETKGRDLKDLLVKKFRHKQMGKQIFQ